VSLYSILIQFQWYQSMFSSVGKTWGIICFGLSGLVLFFNTGILLTQVKRYRQQNVTLYSCIAKRFRKFLHSTLMDIFQRVFLIQVPTLQILTSLEVHHSTSIPKLSVMSVNTLLFVIVELYNMECGKKVLRTPVNPFLNFKCICSVWYS